MDGVMMSPGAKKRQRTKDWKAAERQADETAFKAKRAEQERKRVHRKKEREAAEAVAAAEVLAAGAEASSTPPPQPQASQPPPPQPPPAMPLPAAAAAAVPMAATRAFGHPRMMPRFTAMAMETAYYCPTWPLTHRRRAYSQARLRTVDDRPQAT